MAQERRFVDPYKRGDGNVVRGHGKNVRTSDTDKISGRAARAAENVRGFVEDAEVPERLESLHQKENRSSASLSDSSRNGGQGFGWSTLQWGATATGPGGSQTHSPQRSDVPSTWDINKGQGYVVAADGQTVWLGPEAKLSGVKLQGVAIPNANLAGATFEEVDFDDVNISGGSLAGASLDCVNVSNSDFSFVDMQHVIVNHSRLENVNLSGMNFSGAGVGNTNFVECDMRNVVGDKVQLVRVQLESVYAEKSSWKEAGFSDVGVRLSYFDGSSWAGIDAEKLRVTASSLNGVQASGATFNRFITYSTDLRKMDFMAATATGFDMNKSCRYEAVPPGYAPLHLLESGRLEGRSNSDNEKLPQGFNWESRNDYHIPLWSYQMNGLY